MTPLLRARLWAILFTVGAILWGLNALIALINGTGLDNVLDAAGPSALCAMLAEVWWDRVHVAKHREVRRTWRNGELQVEHRIDQEGERSGTFFGGRR